MLGQMIEDEIENNLKKETLLSKDLLEMHAEDESDLFFEVAMNEEPRKVLRHLARQRILNAWAPREEEVFKMVYQSLM